MNKDFFHKIALVEDLTTYHYKVILLLLEKERTQSQLSKELEASKQNINKTCKKLQTYGIIYISRKDGQLKYFSVNTNIKDLPMQGQTKLELTDLQKEK